MQVLDARVLHRPTAAHRWLPEGPRALPDGRLLWITIQCGADAPHGALHVLDPESGANATTLLPGRPGFALPTDAPGTFLLGMERSIGWFDVATGDFHELVADLDGDRAGTIVNDGEPCRDGLVFGLKDAALADPKAGLYFLRRGDSALFRLRDDQVCSNGKVLRELGGDRVELFDIDSPTRVVRRYVLDVAQGRLDEPAIAVDLRAERGVPDGMCAIPGTEDVVVAMFDPEDAPHGRALRCSLRDGAVRAEYRTAGAAQVTCPAWLSRAGGGLVVLTTAAERLPPERLARQPNAGCLFAVALDA